MIKKFRCEKDTLSINREKKNNKFVKLLRIVLTKYTIIINSHLDHDESVLAEGRALHGERGGSACIGSSEVELVRHHDSAIINTNRKENGS